MLVLRGFGHCYEKNRSSAFDATHHASLNVLKGTDATAIDGFVVYATWCRGMSL